MVPLFSITTDNGPTKFYVGSYWIEGMLGVSDAGNGTVGSGDRNGDGDENDAGSEISLLLLPGKNRLHLGWNTQSELSSAVRTGTTAESGVREGGMFKTIPPHQYG